MTGVLLAAGLASRLRPLTDSLPKSLLQVGGKPILQRTLEALHGAGIERCVIVTGYLHKKIERFANALCLPLELAFIYNAAYEHTNNNYSLWLTREAVDGEEILLLDADIVFHRTILDRLLRSMHRDALIIRKSNTLGNEEIKCELDGEGAVLRIGKYLDPSKAAGESLGIEKFSASTTRRLFEVLERRHVHNEFYEASFQEMIDSGVRLYAIEAGNLPCMEIDTPDDLAVAEDLASNLQ
ncbi:MAG: nucleotidyl transferase [Ignavibacteria bacterium]